MDSLKRQLPGDYAPRIIVVDSLWDKRPIDCRVDLHIAPKPTIWQGEHRLTSEEWWAASNARNTVLCHANSDWILWVDDRCVLLPTCVDAIKDAMEGNYVCFGTYEKRHFMEVEDGEITVPGVVTGADGRLRDAETLFHTKGIVKAYPSWAFGCLVLCPVVMALAVGGFEEACDGMGAEDTAFGAMLCNNSIDMRFDPRLGCVQDRTPGESGPSMRREDKGLKPLDKSHRSIELFHTACNTSNRHLLLQSRRAVLEGKPWPLLFGSREDWHDGEPVNEGFMKKL